MKLQNGVLLTVISMHAGVIDAGHHRVQHKHELEMMTSSKSGKTGSTSYSSYESKSGKSVQLVQSMPMDDDDAMSIVYIGKSSKDVESKSDKEMPGMKAKSEKMDMSKSGKYDDDMSMAADDDMSVVHVGKSGKETESKAGKSEETEVIAEIMHSIRAGKSDKEAGDMSKSGKVEEHMSMADADDMSYVYMGKSGKASDSKAGKAGFLMDAKAAKSGHHYGKSGKASYSMSMVEVDNDMSDEDGEWVPITTEAAITTVADTEAAATTVPPAAETTAAASTAAPESASTTAAQSVASTAAPESRSEKIIEEAMKLLEEGGHGNSDHVHSKAGETVEISSKIASGNHMRPDALQQQSDSASLSVSRYSIAAVCLASLYALSL